MIRIQQNLSAQQRSPMATLDTESFSILLAVVGFFAGAVASVSGFGIGSLLTPVLAVRVGTKLAVAAVSVPHLTATALRFWLLRQHVDRRLLWSFGLMSAAGGAGGGGVPPPPPPPGPQGGFWFV